MIRSAASPAQVTAVIVQSASAKDLGRNTTLSTLPASNVIPRKAQDRTLVTPGHVDRTKVCGWYGKTPIAGNMTSHHDFYNVFSAGQIAMFTPRGIPETGVSTS